LEPTRRRMGEARATRQSARDRTKTTKALEQEKNSSHGESTERYPPGTSSRGIREARDQDEDSENGTEDTTYVEARPNRTMTNPHSKDQAAPTKRAQLAPRRQTLLQTSICRGEQRAGTARHPQQSTPANTGNSQQSWHSD
jgi:hypothetical protein